mmetsp:Transcript_15351/g.61757  ORF Transcript_15351/g.61757 Transcript_15351/m.61757 type:complete len:119 (+) Transcript_15351:1904-2260(+)
MGDARLADAIANELHSTIHVFGHSHLNVDAVLDDGVRYVQNALGHATGPSHGAADAAAAAADGSSADAGGNLSILPVLLWDSEFPEPPPMPRATTPLRDPAPSGGGSAAGQTERPSTR